MTWQAAFDPRAVLFSLLHYANRTQTFPLLYQPKFGALNSPFLKFVVSPKCKKYVEKCETKISQRVLESAW